MLSPGLRMVALRHVYGLSQRELAKRAGVPNSAISVIEHDKSSPSLSSLEKVLRGFPLTTEKFFSISMTSPCCQGVNEADLPCFTSGGTCLSTDFLQLDAYNDSHSGRVSLTRGPTKLMVIFGAVRVHACLFCVELKAGDVLFLPTHSPFRIEVLEPETVWVQASVGPAEKNAARSIVCYGYERAVS